MNEPQGGNSQISDNAEMAQAFGMKGEATSPIPTNSAPPKEEGSSPKDGAGPVSATPETEPPKPDQAKKEPERDALFQKKADEAHRHVIDLLEDKFKLLQDRRMDDQELRQWFDNHPELAQVANRSKRIKDRFRALMERDPGTKNDEALQKRREEQTRKDVEEIDDEPKKAATGDGKPAGIPVTMSELEKFFDERESTLFERQLQRSREQLLEDYAAGRGIVDDQFKQLKAAAEALFKTNPSWEFKDAIIAADRALNPGKTSQVVTPAGGASVPAEKEEEKVDFTQPTALFDKKEFFGVK